MCGVRGGVSWCVSGQGVAEGVGGGSVRGTWRPGAAVLTGDGQEEPEWD